MVDILTNEQSLEAVAAIEPLVKLLSEPNRLRIFALLAQGERCVCDIETAVGLPQNLVSHHLRVLRDDGLITARKDGRWVHYRVSRARLAQVYPALCALFNPDCVNEGPLQKECC